MEGHVYTYEPAAAEMMKRLESGVVLTDEQWCAALIRSKSIQIRKRWPVDELFAVSMSLPGWLGTAQIVMSLPVQSPLVRYPRIEDSKNAIVGELYPSHCGTHFLRMKQFALYQEIGSLPIGNNQLIFDVTVERVKFFNWRNETNPSILRTVPPAPGVIWKGQLTMDVQGVETIADAIPPARGADLDAAVRASIGLAFATWGIGETERRTAILVIDPDTNAYPILASTALSLQVELLHDGRVVEAEDLVVNAYDCPALTNSKNKGPNPTIAFTSLRSIPASLENDTKAHGSWSLKVTGTDKDILGLWHAERRWSGEIVIPIDEARKKELERAGPDGRDPWCSTCR